MYSSPANERLLKESKDFIAWAGLEYGPESTSKNSQREFINPVRELYLPFPFTR